MTAAEEATSVKEMDRPDPIIPRYRRREVMNRHAVHVDSMDKGVYAVGVRRAGEATHTEHLACSCDQFTKRGRCNHWLHVINHSLDGSDCAPHGASPISHDGYVIGDASPVGMIAVPYHQKERSFFTVQVDYAAPRDGPRRLILSPPALADGPDGLHGAVMGYWMPGEGRREIRQLLTEHGAALLASRSSGFLCQTCKFVLTFDTAYNHQNKSVQKFGGAPSNNPARDAACASLEAAWMIDKGCCYSCYLTQQELQESAYVGGGKWNKPLSATRRADPDDLPF